jgi:hypothetical protein
VDEIDLSAYTGKIDETTTTLMSPGFRCGLSGVGQALEEGAATRLSSNNGEWRYQSVSVIPEGEHVVIEVTAADRPGHKTARTQPRP